MCYSASLQVAIAICRIEVVLLNLGVFCWCIAFSIAILLQGPKGEIGVLGPPGPPGKKVLHPGVWHKRTHAFLNLD